MNVKDITEKALLDYNDVFADIINVIIFDGLQCISPTELEDSQARSQYKADGSAIHEQERDIAKKWKDGNVEIAIYGLENQTESERLMPLRVISYDGASYRSQLLRGAKQPVPVITLVLYFGEPRWNYPKSLKTVLNIREGLENFVSDYKINVVEVSWLDDRTIAKFKSDFKIVANFFAQKRKNKNYIPDDPTVIQHVDEVLKLLSAMTGDQKYEEILKEEREVSNMCEVAERLVNQGRAEGIEEGMAKGIEKGQLKLVDAIKQLKSGKTEKQLKAAGFDESTISLAKSCI